MPDALRAWLAANGYRTDWAAYVREEPLHVLATAGPQCVVVLHVCESPPGVFHDVPINSIRISVIEQLNEQPGLNYEVQSGESEIDSAA